MWIREVKSVKFIRVEGGKFVKWVKSEALCTKPMREKGNQTVTVVRKWDLWNSI